MYPIFFIHTFEAFGFSSTKIGNGEADSPEARRRGPEAAVAVEEAPDLSPKAESVHLGGKWTKNYKV